MKLLVSKATYKTLADSTRTGMVLKLLKDQAEKPPPLIAENLTKRKFAEILPIVGIVIGGAFNFSFLGASTQAAQMIFRYINIQRNYPDLQVE